ncbi:MAG: Ig-like domain-containing protein [Alicyclobacillus shizuokensis]|nr:Ig-like domain-containing protein [Alicyclobacillus shizuokensis]
MKRALKGIAAASVVLGTMAAPMSAYAASTHYNTTKVAHESATTLKSITVTKTESFTVTIKDSHNNPIKGALVTFRSSNRSVATASPGDVVTNAKGQATVTITGHKAGTAYFTVTANGVSHKYKVTVTQPAAPTVSITGLSNNQTVLTASQTVTVKSNEKSVKLYLNGKLQSGNGPTFKLTLRDGKNTITAVATNGVETKKQSIYVTLGEPSVSITGLSDGQVVTTASQKVTVNSNEKSVKLYLNGKLQSGSGPDFNLTLREGKNTITAVATNGVDTKKQSIYVTYNAQLAVSSVNVLNAKQIQVTFNQPVDPLSAQTATNYKLGGTNPTRVSLDSTNTVATLTFADGFIGDLNTYQEFDVDGVYNADSSSEVQSYQTALFVSDKTAPTATTSYTAPNVVVKFSEPLKMNAAGTLLDDDATVSVDGTVSTNYTITKDNSASDSLTGVTGLTIPNLSAGTHTIDIVGAEDLAGNKLPAYHATVNVVPDTTAPTVTGVTADGSKIKISFSEPIVDAKLDGTNYSRVDLVINGTDYYVPASDQVDTDGKVYEYDASSLIGSGTFANLSVIVKDAVDASGNHMTAPTSAQTIRVTKDTTPPAVSGNAFVSGKSIVIPFNEPIQAGSPSMTTADITLVTPDGLHLEKSAESLGTVAYVYDANHNGSTTDPGENQYLVLSVNGTDFDNASGSGFRSGTYTVVIPAGAVEDQAATPNPTTSDITVSFTVSDSSHPSNSLTFTPTSPKAGELDFAFGAPVTSSALNPSNYTIDGQALPSGTQLYFNGDYQHVVAKLPAGYITATGYRTIAARNIVDTNGNSLDDAAGAGVAVMLIENVAPVAKSATLESAHEIDVQFSEVVTKPTKGVEVWVNGTKVDPSDVSFALKADANGNNTILTLTTTTFSFDPSQSIVVKFVNGTDLADADGNVIATPAQVSAQ